jgi:hypothetical protein
MDLKLNDEQNMMKKVAADFLRAEAPPYVITEWFQKKVAFIPELYKKAAEVGWLGMMLPDEYGGGGASCTDCAVVFEELGHGDCRWVVADCGSPGEKSAFLFCGEGVARKGCPYCREHMALSYKRKSAAGRPAMGTEKHEAGRRRLIELAAGI